MDKVIETKEFNNKFSELDVGNQRYIIAIQQALIFAQSSEKSSKRIDKRTKQTLPS